MTRPRGYAPWRPHPGTQETLEQVNAILDMYGDHGSMTARQVFYRLVAAYGFPKTDKDYRRLCEYLNRARRARMIPWDAIRDDRRNDHVPDHSFGTPKQWLRLNMPQPEDYILDPQDGQPGLTVVCPSCRAGIGRPCFRHGDVHIFRVISATVGSDPKESKR